LRARLEALKEGDKLEGFRVDQELKSARSRSFLLNARRIEHTPLILLAFEDVTERLRAEKVFQRTEMGLRELLTATVEAIVMTDSAGTIVFANQTATQVFGFTADEMIGLPVDRLVPQRLRGAYAKHRADYLAHFSTRPMEPARDLIGRRKDGTEFPIEVVLGSMERENGLLVVSFITDTTGRRESESKIREYQNKLQRM